MNKEEYKKKLAEIDSRYQNEKNNLYKEFALSNTPYRKGDLIASISGNIIKVEKLFLAFEHSTGYSFIIFEGLQHTMAGKKYKKARKIRIQQRDVAGKIEG